MNREELDDKAFICDVPHNIPVVNLTTARQLIVDFESRTCENCKHFTGRAECNHIDNEQIEANAYFHLMQVNQGFGCNKFEIKQ